MKRFVCRSLGVSLLLYNDALILSTFNVFNQKVAFLFHYIYLKYVGLLMRALAILL